MKTRKIVRVAAVQAAPEFLDLEGSLSKLERLCQRAAGEGAEIIALPESWLPGYPAWLDVSPDAALWDHPGGKEVFVRLMANSVEVPGAAVERICSLAKRIGAALVVGCHERCGRTLYNSLLIINAGGKLVNHHRKLVPTYSERLIWGRGGGQGLKPVELADVRVGGLICWEHWMPLARQLLHDLGEEIHIASWPWVKEMHHIASRHYAFEGRCFVIAAGGLLHANALPPELPAHRDAGDQREAWLLKGGSAIIAPDGRYLAGPVYEEETILMADCNLSEIERESMTLDVSGHYGRKDLFRLEFVPGESS